MSSLFYWKVFAGTAIELILMALPFAILLMMTVRKIPFYLFFYLYRIKNKVIQKHTTQEEDERKKNSLLKQIRGFELFIIVIVFLFVSEITAGKFIYITVLFFYLLYVAMRSKNQIINIIASVLFYVFFLGFIMFLMG